MAKQDNDNGLLLVGTGYVRNRRILGSMKEQIGNLISLKLTSKAETKVRKSRMKESAGNALDSVTIKDATEIAFGSDTFNKLTLGMALSGKSIELDTAAANVADEVVRVTAKDAWLDLAKQNIDRDSVKVKNAAGQAAKSEYIELKDNLGWIKVSPEADSINVGEEIKVSYKTRAGGGIQIEASTETDYDFEFWLDGYNAASQKNFILHIPSMVVAPNSEIDWLSDDFAKAEFTGTAVLVDGNKVPYSYQEFNA